MIPSALASSVSVATPVLNSVVQNGVNATLASTWELSSSPVPGGGTIEVETSPDNSTWTSRTVVSGGSAPLSPATRSTTVNFIATNTYYRIRQILFGATSNWSNSVQFTAALATEPIAPPTSVTITNVTRPFGDRYRVFFTVVQPGAITGFSGVGLRSDTTWSSFSQQDIATGSISSGSTAYTVDLLGGSITGAVFQVTVRNQAGGYESTPVSSVPWTTFIEEEEVVEVLASGDVEIPEWATSIEYWLYGAGGGGGGGLTVIGETDIEQIGGGTYGNRGLLQHDTLTEWTEEELTVVIGVGGLGRDRISGDSLATNGGNSTISDGATLIATASGGVAGVDGMFGDYISESVPDMVTGGPGQTSLDVAAVDGVHDLIPGAPGVTYDKDNPLDPSYSNSSLVTGVSGGYGRLAGGVITYPSSYRWPGGDGGPGACYIRFRNF